MNGPRSVLTLFAVVLGVLVAAVLPAGAVGYASLAPTPAPSPSSDLPDGRVYELATPFNKHGYEVGNAGLGGTEGAGTPIAAPDGEAVTFSAKGPAAEVDNSGTNYEFVAERKIGGWTSRASTAGGVRQNEQVSATLESPIWIDYSPDLKHLVYDIGGPEAGGDVFNGDANLYMLGTDPLENPTWLLREAIQIKGIFGEEFPGIELLGMSPDASVVYIADEAPLLPQDQSRNGWGIYEYRNGRLSEAGTLPDGSVPASGAYPPTVVSVIQDRRLGENNPASFDNQVSEDGRRLLFVSSGELYIHEILPDGSERTVLASASQLPGHGGEPAPDGVATFENPTKRLNPGGGAEASGPTYAYASPDGSHVFFQSADQLTSDAPQGSDLKVYDYDVDTESLEYLPGVTLGGIVTAATDGSSFVFVNGGTSPPELDIWSAGPGGGRVSAVAQLPGGGFVGPGRLVADDSVLVFQAQAPIEGFNDSGGEQIYRYDITTNELGCISCPPVGVKGSGNAYLSFIDQYGNGMGNPEGTLSVNDDRGVSSDGQRIFFGSPDPLVRRDTNGKYDAYEWENGDLFLLSSGTSAQNSFFLDNSVTGGDAFILASDELVGGDNDEAYDVYDARIPRPGDNPPPGAAPCSGAACQGPPSVPQLLGAPPSATFVGVGNLTETSVTKTVATPKRVATKSKLTNALRVCRKRRVKAKRLACERQARKRYAQTKVAATHNGGRGK